jgi:nitrite reductase/ring-hydroxylating ferredoxin subunit
MTWWPVAWSAELADKPLAARVRDDEVALFRDETGAAGAVLDYCPHRRAPLSFGKVVGGKLQCGYHGWTFNGQTGRCVAIPNLRDGEPISERIVVATYQVAERAGVLFVWTGVGAADPLQMPALDAVMTTTAADTEQGEATLDLAHAAWIDGLLNDPARALGLSTYCRFGAPVKMDEQADALTIEQPVALIGNNRKLFGAQKFQGPLQCRYTIWAVSGLVKMVLSDLKGTVVSTILIASIPLSDGRTSVRWRVEFMTRGALLARIVAHLPGHRAQPVFTVAQKNFKTRLPVPAAEASSAWRRLSGPV